jgi:hypothetical protein
LQFVVAQKSNGIRLLNDLGLQISKRLLQFVVAQKSNGIRLLNDLGLQISKRLLQFVVAQKSNAIRLLICSFNITVLQLRLRDGREEEEDGG